MRSLISSALKSLRQRSTRLSGSLIQIKREWLSSLETVAAWAEWSLGLSAPSALEGELYASGETLRELGLLGMVLLHLRDEAA